MYFYLLLIAFKYKSKSYIQINKKALKHNIRDTNFANMYYVLQCITRHTIIQSM